MYICALYIYLGIGTSVDGVTDALRFGISPALTEVLEEVGQNVPIGSRGEENTARSLRSGSKKSELTALLKQQIELQKDLNANVRRIYKGQ